jgi:hypothetical protein
LVDNREKSFIIPQDMERRNNAPPQIPLEIVPGRVQILKKRAQDEWRNIHAAREAMGKPEGRDREEAVEPIRLRLQRVKKVKHDESGWGNGVRHVSKHTPDF